MKRYTDIFKNPLKSDDVTLAVRTTLTMKRSTTSLLTRRLKWGYGKAFSMIMLLEEAGVVGPIRSDATRTILLKNEPAAINAALRQLKKGNN